MGRLGEWWRRVAMLWQGSRFDRELEEEMQLHLELAAEEHRARGLTEEEARGAARRAFGRTLHLREDSRAAWGWSPLETFARDLRHALRSMRRAPTTAVVIVLTLALGIGGSTAIFAVTDALLLKPLPVERPAALRFLTRDSARGDIARFSYLAYQEIKARARTVSALAAVHNPGPGLISVPGESPESLYREWATSEYFSVLGVRPVAGRLFTAEEDASGAKVIVIGEGLWSRVFGRRTEALGSVLVENGRPYTIVGVLPGRFKGLAPDRTADVWFPASKCIARCLQDPACETFKIIARMKDGVPDRVAADELDALFRQHRAALPAPAGRQEGRGGFTGPVRLVYAGAGESVLGRQYRTPLFVLLGLVGLLLLLMCANIGNLLLARSLARERELGTRLALGAGPARLVSQVLAECLLLALAGGALGVWLAVALSRTLVANLEASLDVTPDTRVLAFALAASLTSALLFGVAPAAASARARVSVLLHRTGAFRKARWPLGAPLVVAQVTISVVLLAGAGLFIRSFAALTSEEPGFAREGLVTFSVVTPNGYHPSADPAIRRLLATTRALPGVASVSAGSPVPPGDGPRYRVSVPGFEAATPAASEVTVSEVADGFFETIGVPLLRGRLPGEADRERRGIAVVNETFARKYFPSSDPVGREVELAMSGVDGSPGLGRIQIVGVVADARLRHPRDPVAPAVFPMPAQLWASSLLVRTDAPVAFLSALPAFVRQAEAGLRLAKAGTVAGETDKLLTRERVLAELSAFFGFTALTLAGLGVYGLISHAVARRTRELGIRIALGASPRALRRMVLGRTLLLVAIGLAAGLPAAMAVGQLAASLLYGIAPWDPAALSLSVVVLALAAAVAGAVPARRTARIAPIEAVRCE